MSGVLAFRFDVDSVRCLEEGVPRLVALGRSRGVRFTFFVNMGYSFNWTHNIRHFLGKSRQPAAAPVPAARHALPTTAKLGIGGILKTVLLNPRLGERYRATLDQVHGEGHELGLHGGTDHVVWQRSLAGLDESALRALLMPAYESFSGRYGRPAGFASPGFQCNDAVFDLLDELDFEYSSDLSGEEPFRAAREAGGPSWSHFQVPVNVAGAAQVPLVEEGLAMGLPRRQIVEKCVARIQERKYALLYGHPYVEGVHSDILNDVLEGLGGTHQVVPVREYLRRWKEDHGG